MDFVDKAAKKLSDIYNAFTRKPTPEEKAVRERYKQFKKHVLKNHFGLKVWRAVRKTVVGVFLAAASVSTLTEVFPGLATQTFGDYMKEKGYGENMDAYYRNKDIRVWRNDYIMPFKFAGMVTREEIRQIWNGKEGLSLVANLLWEPVRYSITLKDMIKRVSEYPDAFPFTQNVGQMLFNNETSYIRAGGDEFTLERMLSGTLPFDVAMKGFKFKSDPKALDEMFQKYVMLHEARHADQTIYTFSNMDETDADQFAFAVLKNEGADPAVLAELKQIVLTIRALGGSAGGDRLHYSSEMNDLPRSVLQGIEDPAGIEQFTRVVNIVMSDNFGVFPEDMNAFNRAYLTALRIHADPISSDNRPMREAAEAFIKASNHINELQGFTTLQMDFLTLPRISLGSLYKPYLPEFDFRHTAPERRVVIKIDPPPQMPVPDTTAAPAQDSIAPAVKDTTIVKDTLASNVARDSFLRQLKSPSQTP